MLTGIKKNGIPLMYATFVCGIMMTLYIEAIFLWFVIIFVFQMVLFYLCDFIVHEDSNKGKLYYGMAVFFGLLIIMICCTIAKVPISKFWITVFKGNYVTSKSLWIALLITICFIIGSLIYYCSNVIQNSFLNFLILMIPVLLFLKVGRPLLNIYKITICFMYFLSILHCRQIRLKDESTYLANKEYKWYVFLLLGLLIVPGMMTPKGNIAPFGEMFRQMVMFPMAINSKQNLGFKNEESGNSYGSNSTNEAEILFYVDTKNPTYMERQYYTFYNWETNIWQSKSNPFIDYTKENNKARHGNLEAIYKQIDIALKENPVLKKSVAPEQENLADAIKSLERTATIIPQDFNIFLIPQPLNTMDIIFPKNSQNVARWDQKGMAVVNPTGSKIQDKVERYEAKYIENQIKNPDKILAFIERLKEKNPPNLETVLFKDVQDYYNIMAPEKEKIEDTDVITQDKYPSYITEKAQEITKEATNDYERAKALEAFFHKGDFSYDNKYHSPEAGSEYFMKESKRGACADYATAMALMAQSLDMKVQYVEGFVVSEYDKKKEQYVVRTKNSHAFVKIHVAGLGWMAFEPTVSLSSEYKEKSTENKVQWWKNISFQRVILGMAIFSISLSLFMIIKGCMGEVWFRCSMPFYSNKDVVQRIYNRLWNILLDKRKGTTRLSSEELTRIIWKVYKCDYVVIASCFDQSRYGEAVVSKQNRRAVIGCYKKVYRRIRFYSQHEALDNGNTYDTIRKNIKKR